MDLHKKEKKTRSPEQIGSMGVTGEGRKREGRKEREQRKMYSVIKKKKQKKILNSIILLDDLDF